MTHARHLAAGRLLDCYLANRGSEEVDRRAATHLANCAACAAQYAELAVTMDALRATAEAETEAIFTPDRLHLQQQQIARRLTHAGRAARVIAFPGRIINHHMHAAGARAATRWIAAAAAVGVFVGVGLGVSYDRRAPRSGFSWPAQTTSRAPLSVGQPAHLTTATLRSAAPIAADAASEDAFLSELDSALERPHLQELLPFDELTPHAREVDDRLR